ncbi:MAG: hypothetical protein NTV01_05625 [Bacteroidia bacterium]|nr:hypothetical protein [Bacteroidia bacterium]
MKRMPVKVVWILGFLIGSLNSFGQTAGPNNAGTGTNVTGIGNIAWTNPGNITTTGTPYATAGLANNTSNYLQGTGYGFSIPSPSTILGITVTINRQTSGTISPLIRDNRISLLKSGAIQTTNYAVTGTNWPTTMGPAIYGGIADLWGTTWTASEINDPNFGVVLAVTTTNTTSRTATVDYIQITITYSCPTPAQPSTITGPANPCQGSSQTYDVTNVSSVTYTWTFPTGWAQTGGGTSNSVTVTVGSGSGNITVTPSNACGNGTARTLSVAPTTVPAQPGTIAGSTSPCIGSSFSYSVTNVADVSYNWSFPADWVQTGGGTTNSVTVTIGSTSGSITVIPSNSCGSGTGRSIAVSVTSSVPNQPSAITGFATPCQGTSQSYSVTNVAGVTYTWSFPAGWSQTGGGTTSSVTVNVGSGSGDITVTPSNGCGNGTAQTLAVSPIAVPAQPSIINGSSNPCQGSSQTYDVTNVPDVNYAWAFPTGWVQTGGGTSSSVTVTVGSGSGNITVTPSNACGSGTARSFAVAPATVPAQPSTITGSTTPCLGSSLTYSVTNVAGVIYNWSFPADWAQTGGGTTNSITVTIGSTSGNISVTPSNSCGSGAIRSLPVTVTPSVPDQPSTITGPSSPCLGTSQSYSVTNVAGVTYTWSFPTGWSQTGGGTTSSVTVTVGAGSGNISVTPSNSCGNGTPQTLAVAPMTIPAQPSTITGTTTPCLNSSQSYSVTNVPGVNYTWTFPAIWTQTGGGNTSSVTVTVGSGSGNISVTPSNACGNGTARTLSVTTTTVPAQPSTITGSITLCSGSSQTYSVTNVAGLTYNWTFPAYWTQTGGGNTNSVTVTTGSISGNVSVTPSNSCFSGTPRTLSVTVNPVPTVTIAADYCSIPGKVQLTANASISVTYLWNTGSTTQTILIDLAGSYVVTVTAVTGGCTAQAFINVAKELVVNGSFTDGNTGFTSGYTNNQSANGLQQEELYAINSNPNYNHTQFWGRDHTTNSGNLMIVNGSTGSPQPIVWQETVPVEQNTTYYFSAWAISLNSRGNYAQLRFDVNGVAVGTTAVLNARPENNNSPYDWQRFWGQWNSVSATSAVISIIDLQIAPAGNDFGLDDISFGTLSPVAISAAPKVTGNGGSTSVCTGGEINLSANVTGGSSPFIYQWTGPNGFSSNEQNPQVTTNASSVHNGVYNLSVRDFYAQSYSCNPIYASVTVTVNEGPTINVAATTNGVCFSASSQTTQLTYSAPTGSPTTYSIVWNSTPTNSFAPVTNAPLPASLIIITVPASTATGTYTGTITVKNVGCVSNGTTFTVTVNSSPSINTAAAANSVCFSAGSPTCQSDHNHRSRINSSWNLYRNNHREKCRGMREYWTKFYGHRKRNTICHYFLYQFAMVQYSRVSNGYHFRNNRWHLQLFTSRTYD